MQKGTLKLIWNNRWIFRSILKTIYFNFHYLPLKQAIKLPIILYKPQFIKLKGKIKISSPNISTGMILLGYNRVSIYPYNGIKFENHGGVIVFKGTCKIGNNSVISIGEKGNVEIGNKFSASTTLKLIGYHSITFGENVRVGWECTFMDTDFHKMTKINGGYTKGYGSIKIGNNNWFAAKCHILKKTETTDFCTFSTMSLLNKKYDCRPYTVLGGNPVHEIAYGVYRNTSDDNINYESDI